MTEFGKVLMIAGGILFTAGVLFTVGGRIPWGGFLPGDIHIQRDGFSLVAPLGSMIVVSLLLTLVLNVVVRFFR